MTPDQPKRPETVSIAARIGMIAIRGYQLFFSALWPNTCRFEPSCSAYGMEALRRHGLFKGTGLTLWRVLRCNPWNAGGYDPVPHHHHHCDGSHHGKSARETAPPLT